MRATLRGHPAGGIRGRGVARRVAPSTVMSGSTPGKQPPVASRPGARLREKVSATRSGPPVRSDTPSESAPAFPADRPPGKLAAPGHNSPAGMVARRSVGTTTEPTPMIGNRASRPTSGGHEAAHSKSAAATACDLQGSVHMHLRARRRQVPLRVGLGVARLAKPRSR